MGLLFPPFFDIPGARLEVRSQCRVERGRESRWRSLTRRFDRHSSSPPFDDEVRCNCGCNHYDRDFAGLFEKGQSLTDLLASLK